MRFLWITCAEWLQRIKATENFLFHVKVCLAWMICTNMRSLTSQDSKTYTYFEEITWEIKKGLGCIAGKQLIYGFSFLQFLFREGAGGRGRAGIRGLVMVSF